MGSQLDPLPFSRVGSRERASKSQLSVTWLCETPKWVSPRDLGARQVCFTFSKHTFEYCANTSSIRCESKGRHLVISSSYDTYILFILNLFSYNITYLYWLATSYNSPFFMLSMWLYHWQSMYPFTSMPLQKWTYNSPQHTSKCCCSIALESGAHLQKEVSHLFPRHTLQWLNILITKDKFQILMDVVIIDPIHIDLVQWTSTMIIHVTMMSAQEKTWSYTGRALGNDFIPLVIETYECFHFCFDSFLTACA
jgi:hypothetical protein